MLRGEYPMSFSPRHLLCCCSRRAESATRRERRERRCSYTFILRLCGPRRGSWSPICTGRRRRRRHATDALARAHLTDARVGRPYCPSLPRTLISSTHTDTLRACNTIATPGLRKPWYGLVVFSGRYATERTHSRAAPISRSRPSPGDTQHRTIIIVIIIVSLGKLIGSSSHPHDSSSGVAEAAIACPPAGRQTRPSPRLTYLHISRIHTSPLHASPRNLSLRELPPPPQKVRAKHSSLYEYNRPSAHRIASISVRLIIAHDTHPHLDKEGHEPGYASGTRHESRRSGPSSWPLQRRAPSAMWKYLHGIDRTGAARARVCQDDT